MFLVDVVVEEDPMQVVNFVLANNCRVVLQTNLVLFTVDILVTQGDPVVPGNVTGNVFVDGEATLAFR